MTPPRNSEYRVYDYISQSLKEIGWDIRNPSRHDAGEVYTQNEALQHPELKRYLGNLKPENVIKVSDDIFWVLEAKAEHTEIGQAVEEAKKYAELINQSKKIKCLFATGIAGNKNETYLVETYYFHDNAW